MQIQLLVRTTVAGLCAAALVAVPTLTSTADARAAEHAQAAMPTLTAKVTQQGVTLRGTRGLHAGRVQLVVRGIGDSSISLGSLKRGYSPAAFRRDLVAGFVKNKAAAIRRIYSRADTIGGLAPGATGTIVFPHPGRYFVFIFGDRGPSKLTLFNVGARQRTSTPSVDGRIVAADGPGWTGSSHLPAKGTLLFKNAASYPVLHFMDLQRVQEGTTVDEVLATFQGPQTQGPPPWALPGSLNADVISPHRSMTVDYDLPAGQYMVVCFMPDPDMGGMPHAFMGMIKMIHLT